MAERSLDLICLGRAAVDLYAEQLGARLEDVASFAKYIGGCAANIAVATSVAALVPHVNHIIFCCFSRDSATLHKEALASFGSPCPD